MLSGGFTNKSFSIGEGSSIDISISSVETGHLGSSDSRFLSRIDVTTAEGAQNALDTVDQAMDQISQVRSNLGSSQNHFDSAVQGLSTGMINLEAAQSQISDTDLAEESMIMNQMKLLEQTSTFALTKANSSQDHLLNLIA